MKRYGFMTRRIAELLIRLSRQYFVIETVNFCLTGGRDKKI